jgi:hypothetical protein
MPVWHGLTPWISAAAIALRIAEAGTHRAPRLIAA